jgi:formylglycine-generating enzyme required for sulfatase activity
MGSDRHYPEEAPAHDVTVDGFWIDETPVTNRDFLKFVTPTGKPLFAYALSNQPRGRPENVVRYTAILDMLAAGRSWNAVQEAFGCGRELVARMAKVRREGQRAV